MDILIGNHNHNPLSINPGSTSLVPPHAMIAHTHTHTHAHAHSHSHNHSHSHVHTHNHAIPQPHNHQHTTAPSHSSRKPSPTCRGGPSIASQSSSTATLTTATSTAPATAPATAPRTPSRSPSTAAPVAIPPSTSSSTRLVSSPSTHRQSETLHNPSSPSAVSSDSPSTSIASSSSVSASVSTSNVGSATTQATDPVISRGSSLRSPSPSQAPSSSSTRRQEYEEGGEEASITSLSSQKTATVSAKNDNTASCMASASTADGAVARSQSLDQSLIHRSCSQYESESEADIESESESQSESEVESGSGSGSESRSQPRQAPKFHHNPSPALLLDGSSASDPIPIPLAPIPQPQNHVVKIRDLSHVRGLVRAELLTGTPSEETENVRYDISGMPVEDVIEMVAALLTKITSTNDQNHHEPTQRGVSYSDNPSCLSSVTTSVLAFHGKNIPAITILSYLSRVHRYCPTTYEVFLSLLVYFERMTECVNNQAIRSEKERRSATHLAKERSPAKPKPPSTSAGPPHHQENAGINSSSCSNPTDDPEKCDARNSSDDGDDAACSVKSSNDSASVGTKLSASTSSGNPVAAASSTYFVVDSYNIHRLIIAGVTCASKFFSDVFYTNSRYAKVGGLSLAELNHLELQFLLLNDFRLFIPAENLEAYATMLVEFYAREVVSQLAHIDGE